MSIYDLPEAERKAYFRENKRQSRAKLAGKLTTEEARAKNRQQYLKNKQRYKDKAAVWNKKHGEFMRALGVFNRLKKHYPEALEATSMTVDDLEHWFVENRDTPCKYCGDRDTICADHVVPLSKGGVHEFSNLQIICQRCNSWKSTGTVEELTERIRQMYDRMCV